ncbi:MAG: hypothetical protein ACRD2U_14820 [Terriglobales bacterium]
MRKSRSFGFLAASSFPVFYLFWMIFVGAFAFHEMISGIIGAMLASLGLAIINSCYPARFSPKISELLSLWRLPWYLISETWEIASVAGKDLFRIKRAKSLFRVVSFNAGKCGNASDTARRVLATAYDTMTPNFIALGVNTSDQKLLFHQIARGPVPKMAQELGAQP